MVARNAIDTVQINRLLQAPLCNANFNTRYCFYQYINCSMPSADERRKTKTAVIQLRVDPRLKAVATKAANLDHRNLTNWIEFLILARCKQLDLDQDPSETQENK
jgi:hypothetical protein